MMTSPSSIVADSDDTPPSLPVLVDPQVIIKRAKTTYGKIPITTTTTTTANSISAATTNNSKNEDFEMLEGDTSTSTEGEGSLGRSESLIIPETDFDLPTTVEKVVDRRSRQDRIDEGEKVDDIIDEGLLSTTGRYNLQVDDTSSSPSKARGHYGHSTDPTSEEEEEEEPTKIVRVAEGGFRTSSPCATAEKRGSLITDATSSSDEDDEMDTTISVIRPKTVQEEQDELDAQYAEEDRLAELEEQLAKSRKASASTSTSTSTSISILPNTTLQPSFPLPHLLAGSSSLTSLTTSGLPSPPSTLPRNNDHISVSLTSEDGNLGSSPPVQPSFRKKNRIVDSEEEDDEEEVHSTVKKASTFKRVQSSDDDDDEVIQGTSKTIRANDSTSTTASPLPIKSKRERMEELAKKRAPPVVVVPVEEVAEVQRSRSMSYSDGDSDGHGKRKKSKNAEKKVKRKGHPSKKEEIATNMETAALLRQQNARIESRTKSHMTPAEIAAKRAPAFKVQQTFKPLLALPTPNPTLPAFTATPTVLSEISPSSEIENADTPNQHSTSRVPNSTASPILYATPKPTVRSKGKAVAVVVVEEEEDEEDLPSLAENDARIVLAKEKKSRMEAMEAKKRAAVAKISLVQDDSDSDIEIIAPPPPPTASAFGRKGHTDPKTIEEALATPRLTRDERKIRTLAGNKATHIEDDATDSQLYAAAHRFGKKLGEQERIVPRSLKRDSMGGQVSSLQQSRKPTKAIDLSMEQLNQKLKSQFREQNASVTLQKATKYRSQQNRQREEDQAREIEAFNPKTLIDTVGARKKDLASEKLKEEEEEDAMDGDYEGSQGDDEDEDDEMGSGSDNEVPMGIDAEALESASEGEQEEAEDEEEEESIPLPANNKRRKIQIEDDEDEEDAEEEEEAVVSKKVILPFGIGAESGGFSQFFDDEFSQDIRQGAETAGYKPVGNEKAKLADIGEELLNTAERDEDIALLEARNAFKYDVLATPQVIAPPQQYINKNGLLTQNRPANLYDDEDSSPYHIPTILDSESQGLTQTQVDNTQTPSRNPTTVGRPLKAVDSYGFALTSDQSEPLEDPEPTELAATEVAEEQDDEEEEEEEEGETQDNFAFPSAQVHKLASVFLPPVPVVAAVPKNRVQNAFIDDAADLSDEETGMGAGSADEDERGMDVDDEDLVDNNAVDAELASEQDARADDLRRRQEEADEAENLKHAEGVAAGKARSKAKGLGDFDDDDFDDDNYGMSKHRIKARAKNDTLDALRTNEETASFANAMDLTVDLPEGELDHLMTSPPKEVYKEKKSTSNKYSRPSRRAGESDEDSPDQVSSEEEEEEEVNSSEDEEGFGRTMGQLEYDSRHVEISQNGHSSSPQKKFNISKPKAKAPKLAPRAGDLLDESQYRTHISGNKTYKVIPKDESQDSTNGVTAGARSSVTSFIGQKAKPKATYGGTLEAGNHGKVSTVAKTSMKFRKNNFAY